MTEDEAKTRVCPFRAMWGETRNGDDYFHDGMCIGSECMLWRIHEDEIRHTEFGQKVLRPGKGGYCGCGGKP